MMDVEGSRQSNRQSSHPTATRSRTIDDLRQQIGRVEGPGRSAGRGVLPFDLPGMDKALPEGGLPLSCVHEVQGAYADGAAPGFCAALLARLSQIRGNGLEAAPVLWLEAGQGLYLPGLAHYGLQPGQLFVVSNIRKPADRLWVFEEALRCGALAGVVAELDDADFTASRRLQLAAQAGNTTGIVLHEGTRQGGMASAVTRWQVATMPSMTCPLNAGPPGVGNPSWDVALTHSRGGRPDRWALEWCDGAWQPLPTPSQQPGIMVPAAANDDVQSSFQVSG